MASKRPGDDENNGHSAGADGPDTKKAKNVKQHFNFSIVRDSMYLFKYFLIIITIKLFITYLYFSQYVKRVHGQVA
jgi:hypothetical protein